MTAPPAHLCEEMPWKCPPYQRFGSQMDVPQEKPSLQNSSPFAISQQECTTTLISCWLIPAMTNHGNIQIPLLKRKWANTELAECPELQLALGTCSAPYQLLLDICTTPVTTWHTQCRSHAEAKCASHDLQAVPLLVIPQEVGSQIREGNVGAMAEPPLAC